MARKNPQQKHKGRAGAALGRLLKFGALAGAIVYLRQRQVKNQTGTRK